MARRPKTVTEQTDTADDDMSAPTGGRWYVDWDDERSIRRALNRFERDVRRAQTDVRTWSSGPLWAHVAAWLAVGAWFLWLFGPFSFTNPQLWPVFGDTAAQSWFVSEFRDRVLSGSSPFGWTTEAGGGSAFGYFYFPFPALLFTVFSLVVPDPLAFKLVGATALLGVFGGAAYLFRRVQAPWVVKVGSFISLTLFMFVNKSDTLGGDITSTLQGEYSYGIALAAALVFFAVFKGLLAGTSRVWPSMLWGAVVVASHTNVAVVAATVALGMFVLHIRRAVRVPNSSLWPGVLRVALAAVGVLALTAFWWVPLVQLRGEIAGSFRESAASPFRVLFPQHWLLLTLVGFPGLLVAAVRRRPGAALFVGCAAASFVWFVLGELGVAAGTLWAPRALPFLFLAVAVGWAYWVDLLVHLFPLRPWRTAVAGFVALGVCTGVVLVGYTVTEQAPYRMVYDGTYGRPSGAAYRDLITVFEGLEPGMLAWSGRSGPSTAVAFGTPDIDLDVVRVTDGKLQTFGAFYLESFQGRDVMRLVHSMLNREGPIIGKPQEQFTLDAFNRGVDMLRVAGVRYLVATQGEVRDLAAAHGDLELVGEVRAGEGEFEHIQVYEVSGHGRVAALTVNPQVVSVPEAEFSRRLEQWMIDFASSSDDTYPLLVLDGPAEWGAGGTALDPVEVSNVRFTDESVSFDVDKTGVPVVVRNGWSAAWDVTGADGPYRATPWAMVVVPTDTRVELMFKQPSGQQLGLWVSFGAALLLVFGWLLSVLRSRTRRAP